MNGSETSANGRFDIHDEPQARAGDANGHAAKGRVIAMAEEKGKSVEFESFESDADETISVDEAKEEEKKAEELR